MGWRRTEETDRLIEWSRDDGYATIRLRRRPDGRFAVRLDRLHQAPDGRGYEFEVLADREAADELAEAWRSAYDLAE